MDPQNKNLGFLSFRFLTILGGALVLILAIAYFFYGLQPSFAVGEVEFKISKGDSFKEISGRLSRTELIRSLSVFKIYAVLSGQAQKFKPGIYKLSGTMSVPQIVAAITHPGKNEVSVTIPEGSTLKDIDDILSAAGVIEKGALVDYPLKKVAMNFPFLSGVDSSLEGFLFPDTYRFELNSPVEEVLNRLLQTFQAKAWGLLSGNKNWYDLLILASYLEREVQEFDDRRIVAGILLKRLRAGIPLQVDATISYAKCGGALRGCEDIMVSRSDLALASPYNTYQRLGWTPTPIANPGLAAMKAAVTPKASPYFYYLSAKKTKETVFSKTLEEHNLNRAKYL